MSPKSIPSSPSSSPESELHGAHLKVDTYTDDTQRKMATEKASESEDAV